MPFIVELSVSLCTQQHVKWAGVIALRVTTVTCLLRAQGDVAHRHKPPSTEECGLLFLCSAI